LAGQFWFRVSDARRGWSLLKASWVDFKMAPSQGWELLLAAGWELLHMASPAC